MLYLWFRMIIFAVLNKKNELSTTIRQYTSGAQSIAKQRNAGDQPKHHHKELVGRLLDCII